MDELRKAAIVMLSLEQPAAAELLGRLPKPLVEAVTHELARLEDVTDDERETALAEFSKLANEGRPIARDDVDFISELLRESPDAVETEDVLELGQDSTSGGPFGFLQQAGADDLVALIAEEHPQTISLVMSHLPPTLAAGVLSALPTNTQLDVVRRIADIQQTSPDVVRDVEAGLESRMISAIGRHTEHPRGVLMAARILNVTDRLTHRAILETLAEDDQELVGELRRLMFVFEDVLTLDDEAMQALLEEISTHQWAVALRGASQEIVHKVVSNLPQPAAESLKEEMESLGPVKVSQVEFMQQQIVDAVRRLEDAGDFDVPTETHHVKL